jgi:cellulose synthase/poly-beta-1,6-N-acetylglucosamine synthase-like glycosyltransferase
VPSNVSYAARQSQRVGLEVPTSMGNAKVRPTLTGSWHYRDGSEVITSGAGRDDRRRNTVKSNVFYATRQSQQAGLEVLMSMASAQVRPTLTGMPHAWSDYSSYIPRRTYPRDGVGSHHSHHRGARSYHTVQTSDGQSSQAFSFLVVAALSSILAATAVIAARLASNAVLAIYWIFNAAEIILCLLAFINRRLYVTRPIPSGRTIAVIPAYNEPQDKLYACVRSLLAQTVQIHKIVVVDDGSAEPVVPFYHPRVEWIRQSNRGKRGAHVTGLKRFHPSYVRFVLTVDSDSTPYPDALEQLLRPMNDSKVQAVTGWIHVRNYDESLIARAADINIGSSCVMMRASRSALGALETTSGALSLYRSEVLYDNLAEYETECGTGDDRWLTMRALLRGNVIGVCEAVVETDMPATLWGTYRQRLRWARSWWWMLPFAYARLGWRALLSPTVGLIQLLAAPMVLLWAVLSWSVGFQIQLARPMTAFSFIIAYISVKYALSALYLAGRTSMPLRQKIISFVFGTPVAALLSMLLLMPVRYYALTRLRDNRWQTREVRIETV